jgi:hypothetical protein
MDIGSKHGYPASALSNFAPHPFVFDGVPVASMEGLLQSFKFDKVHMQVEVCKLVGFAAKARGRHKNWQRTQTLHWAGKTYPRDSHGYQGLLTWAYHELFWQNQGFRDALRATGNAVLTHSMGRTNPSETILTQQEFCSRLTILRHALKPIENKS